MKLFKTLFALSIATLLLSCNNEQSLQEYYVENQEDTDFLALDIPTSMFTNSVSLEQEEKETLESIKKINVLALKQDGKQQKFDEEKVKLDEIFKNEKYQLLMKYGGGTRKAELYFTGDDDAIDELIVYGYDDEQGLGVARVLGENMNPQKIMELMKSLDGDNIDVSSIKELAGIFGKSGKEKDSIRIETNLEVGDREKETVDEDKTTEE